MFRSAERVRPSACLPAIHRQHARMWEWAHVHDGCSLVFGLADTLVLLALALARAWPPTCTLSFVRPCLARVGNESLADRSPAVSTGTFRVVPTRVDNVGMMGYKHPGDRGEKNKASIHPSTLSVLKQSRVEYTKPKTEKWPQAHAVDSSTTPTQPRHPHVHPHARTPADTHTRINPLAPPSHTAEGALPHECQQDTIDTGGSMHL